MIRWWLLLSLSIAVTHELRCDEIEGRYVLKDGEFPGKCEPPKGSLSLGNKDQYAILDFSSASEKTINSFLTQKAGGILEITEIFGSIIMVENSKVKNINFGPIKRILGTHVPGNETFIEIRGNQNFKSITTSTNLAISALSGAKKTITISIYNNLQLDEASCNLLKNIINKDDQTNGLIKSHIQNGPNECQFQDPFKSDVYWKPSDKWMEHCQTVRGDFIMESGSLANRSFEFVGEPACLRLINVTMTGFHLKNTFSGRRTATCKNGQKSEIRNNWNLCGEEMSWLARLLNDDSVPVEMAEESCLITCIDRGQVDHPYVLCRSITFAAIINQWYVSTVYAPHFKHLTKGTTITVKDTVTAVNISLPNLAQVNEFVVTNNGILKEIHLPQLRTAKKIAIYKNAILTKINLENLESLDVLEIYDNPLLVEVILPAGKPRINLNSLKITGNLDFDHIRHMPFYIPKNSQSNVICNITSPTVASNIGEIMLCTEIYGDLKLSGKNMDTPDVERFQATHLYGCLTVEETNLWDMDWLLKRPLGDQKYEHTEIHCNGSPIIFKNNPYLCPNRYERQETNYTIIGIHTPECARTTCDGDLWSGCSSYYGDLIISNYFRERLAYIHTLVDIRGQLFIQDLKVKELDFPNLQYIGGEKTPLLTVTDNLNLEVLRMPKMKQLIPRRGASGQLAYLKNNPQLANLSQFLPPGMQCQNSTNGTCYHDGIFPIRVIVENGWKIWQLVLLGLAGAAVLAMLVGAFVWCLHKRELRKHNLMYIYFRTYRGYELLPLIYERVPFIKPDMKPILNQIICNGLMRYNLINWRQRFLEHKEERMDYFAARYPYNKMEFYKCTYYLKIAGSYDRFYDKLKEMIEEKKAKLGNKRIYPAKPRRGKYPRKFRTVHILHVGDEWEKRTLTDLGSPGRSIEIVRKCGLCYYTKQELKDVKKSGDLPPRPAKVGKSLVGQLVEVTLKDKKQKEEIVMDRVEMTVIPLPTPMSGEFWNWNFVNWFHLLYLVNRYRGVIHTDNPQYFISINMILATWNILLNPNWREKCDNDNLIELGEGVYKRYRALYNPESDPIDSWLMWVNAVTSYYVALIPKANREREHEEYMFRLNIDLFGRDDPWKMDQRRTEHVEKKSTVIHWHLEQEIPLDEDTPFTETIKLSLEEPKPDFKWGEEEYFPMKPDDDVEELLAKNPDGGKVTIPKAPKRHSMDIRIKKKQKLDEELKAKNRTDKEKESNTNRESQPAETDRTSRKEGNQQMTETERAPKPAAGGESDSNH